MVKWRATAVLYVKRFAKEPYVCHTRPDMLWRRRQL